MKQFYRHITIFLLFLQGMGTGVVNGQNGFYVPANGKIFFTSDTATIFSNVSNNGQLGLGKNAVVNFKGQQWENSLTGTITDESNSGNGTNGYGGTVQFITPDISASVSINQRQKLIGGYNAAIRTGAAFSQISIANPSGVVLTSGSAKIRRRLHFGSGHLFLNENILVVGNNGPGEISGYNENRFIVTDTSPSGGLLIREKISSADGMVTFPVGVSESLYSPAALSLDASEPDDFFVGVFKGVRSHALTGDEITDITVNKTWYIGKLGRPEQDIVNIVLQHRFEEEGNFFRMNRMQSFISTYSDGAWDTIGPRSAPAPGILTTSSFVMGSGTNTRTFSGSISSGSYFTKMSMLRDIAPFKTDVLLRANRFNYQKVTVYWTTYPEVHVSYFIVQRRLSNESDFKEVGRAASKATDPNVPQRIDYQIENDDNYSGISYFRLMVVDDKGNISYSNIVPVGPHPGGSGLTLWPNPAQCRFFAGISGIIPIEKLVIWNELGMKIYEEKVSGRNIIPLSIYKPGAYFVGYLNFSGQLMETKKLLIVGY